METPNKKNVSKNNLDKLSALPDVALHHILSFLDMKEVVQTSLLASRWRYLWVSLPVISCSHLLWKNENQYIRFKNFVAIVLLLRNDSDIEKFELGCSRYYDSDQVCAWITCAIRRHVKEMHLKVCPDRQIELPRSLFSSGIRVLELNFASTDKRLIYIKIPNLICSMSKLTTLILMCVELPVGNSNAELFFSYPVLENLTMIDCRHGHLKVLGISTPRLQNFTMQNKQVNWNKNFRISNLSLLVSAKIHLGFVGSESMVQLLEDISSAKTIDLSLDEFEEWFYEEWYSSDEKASAFTNPRCLKLTVPEMSTPWIVLMLKMFPCIENFVLCIGDPAHYLQDLFAGINYNLKCVDIGLLTGDEDDYKCLETLLKNAQVLEKLVIRIDKELSSSEKLTFGDKILGLFRASPRVAIFYYCF